VKIARVEAARYRLPLTRAFRAGGMELHERSGLVVCVHDDEGRRGYGEISPLLGLHRETLADAEDALPDAAARIRGRSFARFEDVELAPDLSPMPSLCFGLEMAAAGLFASQAGTPPAGLFASSPHREVLINALFAGSLEDARAACETGALAAYPCVKVKIGRHAAAVDREILTTLLAGLPPTTLLRLDGNRSLDLPQALERLRGLPRERIDYLEEPLAEPGQLLGLHEATGLRMGLDETLHEPAHAELWAAAHVKAWIVKPSLFGPGKRLRALSAEAARTGTQLVISSALESGLGLWYLAQRAAALPGADVASGLGTDTWLAEDLVAPRFDSRGGAVRTDAWQGTPSAARLKALRFEEVV
jgi:O-succinylbenzoate synthase